MTDDRIAFVRARLDEDEQDLAQLRQWAELGDHSQGRLWVMGGASAVMSAQRAMREVEAKRRILAEHGPEEVASLDRETWGQLFIVCRRCKLGERQVAAPCTTLRLLALSYASHPHYREEWKP